MEEDDDDFYGGAADANNDGDHVMSGQEAVKAEGMDVSDEEEEEDSDDDVQFTLEKPEPSKPEAAATTRSAARAAKVESSATPQPKATAPSTTTRQSTAEQAVKSELLHNGKEGKDFPEYRTSDIDVEQDPTWQAAGKKITELDIDADLAEHSKPWRLPGTDVTDFFNYGFDEYTWTQYCAKQNAMSNSIGELKDQDSMMKSMLGSMPGEGMPDMNQMMQMMMGGMGGGDPSKMDLSQMMAMGMPGMPGMPPGGPGQQSSSGFSGPGGFAGQGESNSPLPQAGQGFQAPLGPSALQGGGMDGFSSQQMAIMQQEQHQGGGGGGLGGGRGRGRRGRGYY